MNILVTLPREGSLTRLFTPALQDRLTQIGPVHWNKANRQFTPAELRDAIRDCHVCITGWEAPRIGAEAIAEADQLRLLLHIGGTVAPVASDALYQRGIKVCSANRVMARFVAESILAQILAGLRQIPYFDRAMHAGATWPRDPARPATLFDQTVGFVGLGSVGQLLLPLLQPFNVSVLVYDPYSPPEACADYPSVRSASLDEVLAHSAIVSIHASLTKETTGLINRARLRQMRAGALLVNAARGAIIDEVALAEELHTGRIRASLDVFTTEPLSLESPLRGLDNVILAPHQAGTPSHAHLAAAMIEEAERFSRGQPLEHEVSHAQFQRMTRQPGQDP